MPTIKLSGIFPPITTPFNHSGDIYTAKIRHNVEKWNLTNLAGYAVCTATGEAPYLTEPEKLFLWEEVAKFAPASKLLIAGTSMESIRETIHLTNLAAGLGYKCAQVDAPLCYRPFHDPTLYFRAVADQTQIPLIVSAPHLGADALAKLTEHPNIVSTVSTDARAAATGAIIPYACAAPFSCLTIAEAIQRREDEAAEDWRGRIATAVTLVTDRYGIPGLKYAMDFNGYYGGPPRLPMIPIPRPAQIEIEAAFHGLRG